MKSLQDINEQYIKDIFYFFSQEYTRMYNNGNITPTDLMSKIKHAINHQIHIRLKLNGFLHDYKLDVNCEGEEKNIVRDKKLEKLLNNDDIEIPNIKTHITFHYQINKAIEIKQIEITIT